MSEKASNKKEFTIQKMEKYKEQRKCPTCKKRCFGDMVICTMCQEYSYCSKDCLEQDRGRHKLLCDLVGLRKGVLQVIPGKVVQQAKFLDDEGDFKPLQNATTEKDQQSRVTTSRVARESDTHGDSRGASLANGRFGHCSSASSQEDLSGESFGDGWWKAKKSHTQTGHGKETKAEEDKEDKEDKEEMKEKEDKEDESTLGEISEGATGGQELVPYIPDRNGEDAKEGPKKLEKCLYCQKASYTMLKCSRCRVGRYCNKECQKKDFPKHKKGCAVRGRFQTALEKIPQAMMLQFMLGFGVPRLNLQLANMPNELHYMLFRVGVAILLEIVGPYYHPFRLGAIVRDIDGVETHILFYDPMNIYYHQTVWFPLPVPLASCLKPGNFILLLNTHWHHFLDGTVGIRVDDLDTVHFILD